MVFWDTKGDKSVAADGLGDVLELLHATHEIVISTQGTSQHRVLQGRRGMVMGLHVDHCGDGRRLVALSLIKLETRDKGAREGKQTEVKEVK